MVQYSQQFDDLDTVDKWAKEVLDKQQRKTHDLIKVVRDDSGVTTVTCTCGLMLDLPERLSTKYPRGMRVFPFGFDVRHVNRDHDLENWFYRQAGHRDVAYAQDPRVFIALFASGSGTPIRKIWCAACREFHVFYHGGGTHLYRQSAHTEQVDRHLARCTAIAEEDAMREWATTLWRAVKSAKRGTKFFGRIPRLENRNRGSGAAPAE